MKREFTVAVGAAGIVVASLAGCSDNKSNTSGPTTTASVPGSGTAATSPAKATVTIDGKDRTVQGQVTCVTTGGDVNIGVGEASTGISAVVTEGDSPQVKSVALGTLNGVNLLYQAGANQGNAEATKDGASYKITGTATGIDTANPTQPTKKPFEIDVSCP